MANIPSLALPSSRLAPSTCWSHPLRYAREFPVCHPAVEHVVFKALAKDRTQRYENVTAFANALQDACKDASSTAINNLMPQPSSLSITTLAIPAETSTLSDEIKPKLSSLSVTTLAVPAETSILPDEIKPTQPLRHPGKVWQTVLILLAVVAVIAASVRLWYNIISSHVSTHYTISALTKYNSTPIVKDIPRVIANST